ncbi:MAG: DUF1598 domain-containing protein [Planctomycetaceae bacterium]|nr:DUF1598 domain-containing protein [Planctomycetaceae bacterium]
MAAILTVSLLPGLSFAESVDVNAVKKTVAAHLEAGEFQSAITLAKSVEQDSDRSEILQQIANQQIASGELQASKATLRQMPVNRTRVQLSAKRATKQSQAGTGADFDSLIELIQSQTAGPWFDIDGVGGTIDEFETGVRVDPTGLLARLTKTEDKNRLKELGLKSRKANLNADMSQVSHMRMVSLTRLEQAVAQRLAQGLPVVESMKNLAGIHQIQHVFVYPETGEIVIAGPAAGWEYSERGWAVSSHNGSPVLQLDDMVTVLRTFSPEGEGMFGCSINPRQQGMRDLKEYVEKSQARGPISSKSVRSWARQLQKKLGQQDVVIYGVPATSRVARVIVEADFRMKLVGIGKLDGGSEIPDYFELMSSSQIADTGSLDALRWWMSLKCKSVLKSNDAKAFEIRGTSVLCQSENQFINDQGERIQTGTSEATNQKFASNFTENYQRLAQQDIVFADMQNVFDLAMVAALINKERLAESVNWDLGSFAVNGQYQPQMYEAPLTVDSVVNHKVFNGKNIVVQVAGGVRVDAKKWLTDMQPAPRLAGVAKNAKAPQLAQGNWWWDVKK